jgi:hypothetical protein
VASTGLPPAGSLAEEAIGCNRTRDLTEARTIYTERTPWAGWVRAVLWGAITVSCYPILAGWDTELPVIERSLIVSGIVGIGVLVEIVLGGLTVVVRDTGILLHLGMVPLVRRTVPLSEIVSLESVQYHPLRDFGGWGVRGWGKRKAWSARGDRAVALVLEGERLLLIGSDQPRRLEERIRLAMGGP